MKVYLATATKLPIEATPVPAFQAIAQADKHKIHLLTDDPKNADIILFVDPHQHTDWHLHAIQDHPLTLRYRNKTLIYNERDYPWCAMPGIYVSMPQSTFDARRQRAYSYYTTMHTFSEMTVHDLDLLFSFMGSRSHKIRERVLKLSHPRAYVENTSNINFFDFSEARNERQIQTQKEKFAQILNRSKFVLCPRGTGSSSIRMYEVMAAGRVPVIISDEWVAPIGPDWNRCSLRVPEAQIEKIPALLEANENRFEEFAYNARKTYQEWFAPDVMFHHLVENCAELLKNEEIFQSSQPAWQNRQYLRCALRNGKGQVRAYLGRRKQLLKKLVKRPS